MAHKVIWTESAIDDLNAIIEYIARDSKFSAQRVYSKFNELISGYGLHPRAATIVPELNAEFYRHKLVFGWRVIYRIDDLNGELYILAIIHSKKLFKTIQGRFDEI